MWSDSDLQHDIEKELAWEPSVHTVQIAVIVKAGAVDLAGHVNTYAEKCAAERAAWRVAHVKTVANRIRVDLPAGSAQTDDDIALAAMGSLEWNCLVPATVEVQVSDACVILTGTVEWKHQSDEAERALTPLKGITGIRNDIVVKPGVQLGDARPLIDDALRRNSLVDSSHIKAHVSHGLVTVRGTARCRAEQEEALHAAWSAPGVEKVEDHISIGS